VFAWSRNEVKGKSMLTFARDLDVQYKTAFMPAHELRDAMASSIKTLRIGGEGRVAEIEGAYFGGHVRPANVASDRIDLRPAEAFRSGAPLISDERPGLWHHGMPGLESTRKTKLNGAKDKLAASDRVADEVQLHDSNPAVVLTDGKDL
jgi:hypothetical protein